MGSQTAEANAEHTCSIDKGENMAFPACLPKWQAQSTLHLPPWHLLGPGEEKA
jgi:hypothetical protein